MTHKKAILSFMIILFLAVSLGCVSSENTEKKDALAKCLTSKGVKMYGAYWCQHCNNQKKMFGDSFKYVDYVECDANGPDGNPAACKEKNISIFPTWIINEMKYSGEHELNTLAKLAGCSY